MREEFRSYAEHGWALVPIRPGSKSPQGANWNQPQNLITDPAAAERLSAAGLAHCASGTCAIDVDDYEKAGAWLAERGVDLNALFAAPDSVQLCSGRPGHGKLLYALSSPMASHQIKEDKRCILDFRCATSGGLTVQDVLPPSIHPDTGLPYKWAYGDDLIAHWTNLPDLPKELYDLWYGELEAKSPISKDVPEKRSDLTELRELLPKHDPDMSRDEWVRVGMIVHHETDGSAEGFNVWDEWSAQGKKYKGREDLEPVWRSFHDAPGNVTIGSLRQDTVATVDDFAVVDPNDLVTGAWEAVKKERASRFALEHVAETALRPPPVWLIKDVLPQADLAMLYGESGSGKSFIALDIAFAVSTGIQWDHRETTKGSVVWIAAEAAGSMRSRVKAYAQANQMQLENADLWVIGETPSLMQPEDCDALIAAVTPKQPVMIIVDTLAAASAGANENSVEDMGTVLGHCRKLNAATGALVVLIHHSGKDASKGARGSSAIRAAVHTELNVYTHAGIRVLAVSKQRDGEEGERWPFRLSPVTVDFDTALQSCTVELLDKAALTGVTDSKLGKNQKIVFKTMHDLVPVEGGFVPLVELFETSLRNFTINPSGKDDRERRTRAALEALADQGLLVIEDDLVRFGSLDDAS